MHNARPFRRALQRMVRLLIGLAVCASGAQAHITGVAAASDLSKLIVSADTLPAGWVLNSQESDNAISAFAPKPVSGYGAGYSLGQRSPGSQIADLALYEYADRATALASPGFADRNIYWGHGNTTYEDLQGYGDGPTYRAYPIGRGVASGITFVDNSIVVFVRVDGFDSVDQANAIASQLATAEDTLLKSAAAPAVGNISRPTGQTGNSDSNPKPAVQPVSDTLAGIGGKLAFIDRAGDLSVWDSATGSTRTLVPAGASVLDFPRWSPDGKLIAFSRHDPTEGYCGCAGLPQHLEVVSADGVSAPRRVIPKDGEAIDSLQWFPDGQVLAYGFGGNGNYQSGRVNLDGKGNMDLYHAQDAQETFLSTYLDPAVAPDGQHVASATGAQTGKPGIFVSASDGSDGTQLIDLGQQDGFGLTVAWTPDGSGVVYATGAAVSVVPLDGGPSTDLVDVPGHVDSDVAPVISGDGSTVAFLYTSNDPPRYDVAWNLGMSRLADAQLATIGGAFPGTRLQWVGGKAGVLYVARTSYNEPATLRFGSLSTDSATDVVGISDRANNAFDWHQ